MPRVEIKKKEYKLLDLKGWITAQMKIHHLRQVDIADALGLDQPQISGRLKIPKNGERVNPDPWTYGDLLTLFELFGTPDEEKKRIMTL